MTPSFQILGSGAGDANFGSPDSADLPAEDRRRYTCNYLTPDILIDFNEHTPEAIIAHGIKPGSIRHLLVSHGHFDHFHPLEIIRFAASLPHPLRVYGNNMVIDNLELCRHTVYDETSGRFVRHEESFNVELVRLAVGEPATVGDATVTPLLGNHFMNKAYGIMEQQSLNFLIRMPGHARELSIFYGLDSSYTMPQTLEQLTDTRVDLAIMDATFGHREIDPKLSGHHNWAMLDETLDDLRAVGCIDDHTVIVASHLSCGNIGVHEDVVAEQTPRGITVAYDGLTLPLDQPRACRGHESPSSTLSAPTAVGRSPCP